MHNSKIGSFARFQNPTEIPSIRDRPDFHDLSHFEIRPRLDGEGNTDGFAVLAQAPQQITRRGG